VMLAADAPPRPKITGVAHIAIFVKNVDQARAYYKDFLGFAEPFSLNNPDGTLALTFFKINERQYIEVFPERAAGSDRLNHISIETDDAEAMYKYLAARGVKVPAKVGTGRTGNANFNVKDPEGHTVEIVEYKPEGWNVRERGKFMPETRIATRMSHVGIIVGALEAEMKFYRDILGFRETWRGSRDGKQLSWVNMKLPDSDDYIEFMLYDSLPEPTKRGARRVAAGNRRRRSPSSPNAQASRLSGSAARSGSPVAGAAHRVGVILGKNSPTVVFLWDCLGLSSFPGQQSTFPSRHRDRGVHPDAPQRTRNPGRLHANKKHGH
jgi:catechol 2,3-dioxygenase-like lactoylglutathione lyase family enzyme